MFTLCVIINAKSHEALTLAEFLLARKSQLIVFIRRQSTFRDGSRLNSLFHAVLNVHPDFIVNILVTL